MLYRPDLPPPGSVYHVDSATTAGRIEYPYDARGILPDFPISMAGWFWIDSGFNNTWMCWGGLDNGATQTDWLYLYLRSDSWFELHTDTTNTSYESGGVSGGTWPSRAAWHFVSWTQWGAATNLHELWIDGVRYQNGAILGALPTGSTIYLFFGANRSWSTEGWDGYSTECAVWQGRIGGAEHWAMWRGGKSPLDIRRGDLVAYLPDGYNDVILGSPWNLVGTTTPVRSGQAPPISYTSRLVGRSMVSITSTSALRTIRYANFDLATGSNDGTSEANAWQSWSAMKSGLIGGEHVYIKRTSSRHSVASYETLASPLGGTHQHPMVWEGYATTPGDGNDNGISNFMWFTMYRWTVNCHNLTLKYLDLQGNSIQPMFEGTGEHLMLYRCKVWSANGSTILVNKNWITILNCHLQHTNTGAGQSFLINAGVGQVIGCLIQSSNTGNAGGILRGINSGSSCAAFINNIIDGSGTTNNNVGIYFSGSGGYDDRRLTFGNSIRECNIGIYTQDTSTGVGTQRSSYAMNLIYDCNTGISSGDADGVCVHGVEIFGNAVGATTRYNNLGSDVMGLIQDVTLTASPWTNPGSNDYSLNATAGGGAAAKDVAVPTDPDVDGTDENGLDIGATQDGS